MPTANPPAVDDARPSDLAMSRSRILQPEKYPPLLRPFPDPIHLIFGFARRFHAGVTAFFEYAKNCKSFR